MEPPNIQALIGEDLMRALIGKILTFEQEDGVMISVEVIDILQDGTIVAEEICQKNARND